MKAFVTNPIYKNALHEMCRSLAMCSEYDMVVEISLMMGTGRTCISCYIHHNINNSQMA